MCIQRSSALCRWQGYCGGGDGVLEFLFGKFIYFSLRSVLGNFNNISIDARKKIHRYRLDLDIDIKVTLITDIVQILFLLLTLYALYTLKQCYLVHKDSLWLYSFQNNLFYQNKRSHNLKKKKKKFLLIFFK